VPIRAEDLVGSGSIGPRALRFLGACVRGRVNIVISGGAGSGKTTLLGVLSGFIPDDERLITIEDAAELRLAKPHVVSLEARPTQRRGPGRDHRSGSRPQRPADATRPDHRRRDSRWGSSGHAAGDEHGSRGKPRHRAREKRERDTSSGRQVTSEELVGLA
jgi:energy-coupling factor transporter ATP-binding protein EcfA2